MPEIDYDRVNEIVEQSQKLYPDMDRYVLWILACDYYLKEEAKIEIEADEQFEGMYERCKNETKTKEYKNVEIVE